MLKLTGITKDYQVADTKVRALKGIDLCFRKNEFVSILGPSGCGKTTMLNIIGGLDHATNGDLSIYGRSTREYKDRDWDVYRNHRIGFIFQSYNLIPHQTVLGNVELALTIAGMSKEERVAKAKAALDKVGLSDQYEKRPNQLSGGQCQRVAIARSLVNDPEILLADEPTGALDTETSKQIMDLVQEIAKERLVIMVTHNPELAEVYSTRIIRLLDGLLVSDSNPFSIEDEQKENTRIMAEQAAAEQKIESDDAAAGRKTKKKERAKMSLWTTFKLSLQNLFSKKKRTVLTSIASSIGIIGISLVLSISYGVQGFIKSMQNDMLSGNPVVIAESTFDIGSMMSMSGPLEKANIIKEHGYVNVDEMVKTLAERASSMEDMMIENNIKQEYVDYILAMPEGYNADISLDYGFDITNNLYMDFYENDEDEAINMSLTTLRTIYTDILKNNPATKDYAGLVMGLSNVFMQAPDNDEYIESQYDILDGEIAKAENEVMIVLDEDSMLTDLLLAQLGYYNQEEFINAVYKATEDDKYDNTIPEKNKFSYEELKGRTFMWYPNDTVLSKNNLIPQSPFIYNGYSDGFTKTETVTVDGEQVTRGKGGIELKIAGILQPKEDISYGSLTSGFYYTQALTEHIMEDSINSEIIDYMLEIEADMFPAVTELGNEDSAVAIGFIYQYSFEGVSVGPKATTLGKSNAMMEMLGGMFGGMMGGSGNSAAASIKTITLRELGGGKVVIEKDEDGNEISRTATKLPSSISIFSTDLKQKDKALAYLDAWNQDGDLVIGGVTYELADREEIVYTDTLSLIFGMIGTVIDMITIALIGFTSLSLVVSCVMIAIVTYISVVERTKEIGVIRSLGGSKRNVSNLFIAETGIIGFTAGMIAVIFTYIVTLLLNLLTGTLAGITIAAFPINYALIMVTLSIGLTLISGLTPSGAAAKKDPVVALRTE